MYDITVENDHNFLIRSNGHDVVSSNCFVILDEGQNASKMQMKLIMTRLGQNSKMVIDGDLGQSDIGTINGLAYLTAKLKVNPVEDIALVEFDKHDIMRNKLIEEIEKLFTNKYNLEGVVHSNKD